MALLLHHHTYVRPEVTLGMTSPPQPAQGSGTAASGCTLCVSTVPIEAVLVRRGSWPVGLGSVSAAALISRLRISTICCPALQACKRPGSGRTQSVQDQVGLVSAQNDARALPVISAGLKAAGSAHHARPETLASRSGWISWGCARYATISRGMPIGLAMRRPPSA
eukprot:scaffold131745_cov66-Phaeocystis_antarctica.AAC.2